MQDRRVVATATDYEDFPWPRPPRGTTSPRWVGNGFVTGDNFHRILVFDAAQSHWSSELTELHEAEAGSDHPIDRASRRFAVRSLTRYVTHDAPLVLDVGSSSGYVLAEIRRAVPRARLIASDYLLRPLERLGERMPSLPILQFDLRACPLPDRCVDAVTALNVLEHIDDDIVALRQIARILKPGGAAHIEVPAGPALYDIYDEQLMHHRRYRLNDVTAKARESGFEILFATHLGFLLYPVFCSIKKRNRRLLTRPAAEKRTIVARQIRQTSRSRFLDMLLRVEEAVGSAVRLPVGIRCIVALRRRA